ncbi:hypothetical protein KY290_025213 [Solanum tuberosum]|uniref:Uncharacterized protein n=1 Tax=Solanum tuberosum TaxID=4113 RepID=A0ABQ7UUZ3_SOLTU|nr:hypothetical protein KY290_025213 [Solanum tuberosum]
MLCSSNTKQLKIDQTKKVDSQSSESLVYVDQVPFTISLEENLHNNENQVVNEDEHHVQNDQYDVVDAPVQDDVIDPQPIIDTLYDSLRRSARGRIPLSRYSLNEYVLLTDGGELESLDEAMKNEDKKVV